MKKILYLIFFLFFDLLTAQNKYKPTWESLDSRETPEWFSDSKFGIFIHWGLYSVPGYTKKGTYAEWYWNALNENPNTDKKHRRERHHAITKFHNENYGEDFDYSEFRKDFKAELFKAEEWADVFKRSGAKYIVLTSKHHDGYCLFPSKEASESYGMAWNSVDSGPKRDIAGELTNAVRAEGIKMGMYYSIWDWYNPYWNIQQQKVLSSGSLAVDFKGDKSSSSQFSKKEVKAAEKGLDKYVHEVMYPQVKQLVEDYQPSLLFSDGDWWMDYNKWQTLPLLTWVFNEAPNKEEVVINDRWGKVRGEHGSYYTTEYGSGFSDGSKPWEENRGIGMSFGINRIENIDDYRTEKELIFMLMDIVSRGGNLLLNIGPNTDGTIPVIMQERLIQIGNWLDIYGEGIYGTRQWIKDAQWSEGKMPVFSKSDFHSGFPIYQMTIDPKEGDSVKEFWFTQKNNNVYAFAPEWPKKDKIFIKDIIITKETKVSLMSNSFALPFVQKEDGIEIDISSIKLWDLKSQFVFGFKISNTNSSK